MRYIRTDNPAHPAQLLQIFAHGQLFDFVLLHAEEEHYPFRNDADKFAYYIDGKPIPNYADHHHNVYHMVLYTEGENELSLNGTQYPSKRGVLVLTAPGEPHNLYALPTETSRIVSKELTIVLENATDQLLLPLHELFSLYAGIELPQVTFPCQLSERQTAVLEGLYAVLFERLSRQHEMRWFTEKQSLFQILAFIIEEVYLPERACPTSQDLVIRGIKEELEHRYADRITLEDLSQKACVSVGYLCRLFKARFGISPIAYQQEIRIRTAGVLLRSTSQTIEEIAQQVGFADICAFGRAFRRSHHCSPGAYRKNRNRSEGTPG